MSAFHPNQTLPSRSSEPFVGLSGCVGVRGPSNLKAIDACTTRLRLRLGDAFAIDEPALRALGARGIVRPGGNALQVVLGPIADQVAGELRAAASDVSHASAKDVAAAIADALGAAGIRGVDVRASRLL